MNRKFTPPHVTPPSSNGHHETPLDISGVSLRPQAPAHKPTTFAPALPLRGLGPLLYALHRFHVGGAPLARYVAALWLLIALGAAGGLIPGRWYTVAVALCLLAGQLALGARYRRRQYISFSSAPQPAIGESPLATSEKVPVYATGLLSVEGRYRHFSALPGYYRTFATGEHALLCLVQERKWLGSAQWPADELGMWYAFINPADIHQLVWGTLRFGATAYPAIAVEYRLEIPAGPTHKRPEIRQETLYIATPQWRDAQRLYVDLLNNLPAGKVVTPLSALR